MDITFNTDEGKFNYRVVAVILHDGKLLATKNNDAPYYCLPGGRVQMGESAEKAILREVHEELGISARIERPLWFNQAFFEEDVDGTIFHELCVYFLLDVQDSVIPTDSKYFTTQEGLKVNKFEWLTIEEVKKAYLYPTFLKQEIDNLPTKLEMRTEIQLDKEKRGKITIRETVPSDVNTLSEIQTMAFRPLYDKYQDKGNPCLRGPSDILNRLGNKRFKYFTILDDETIVGGIMYRTTGSGVFFNSLQPGEYYLQRLYIHPNRQGEKIAQTAIRLCEQKFPDANAFVVDFPVDLEANRRCYEAVGFKDTGDRAEPEKGLVLAFYVKEADII